MYIDAASVRYLEGVGGIHKVLLPVEQNTFFLEQTLIIKSGVVLDGAGGTLLPSESFSGQFLVATDLGATTAGVVNAEMNGNDEVTDAVMIIGENSNKVFVYNNKFVHNNSARTQSLAGDGGATTGLKLGSNTSQVYIDSNSFRYVPSGIAITGQQSTGVYINYNTFNHWRQRAIYVVARQKPHSNINIVRNRINPPLKGTIKQPIAFQRTASSRGATNVDIVENNIFGGKVPHLKKGVTSNNGTADSVSLHEVSNFKISSNCITNGGEVGIVVECDVILDDIIGGVA